MQRVLFLIDYDNLSLNQKNNLQLQIEKMLFKLICKTNSNRRIFGTARLYGGWFESNIPTKQSVELDTMFQDSLVGSIFCENGAYDYHVDVKLAKSLISVPDKDFWNTYRIRQNRIKGLRIDKEAKNCSYPNSSVPKLLSLLQDGKCPHTDCPNHQEKYLWYRSEQKMVDSMLSCDIIDSTILNSSYDFVLVISSDDDFIPALVLASATRRNKIALVLPKRNNRRNIASIQLSCAIWELE